MRLFSINCTTTYFFSDQMGQILELDEGYPTEVHKGLIRLISRVFSDFEKKGTILYPNIFPGVQFNSRDFYFREPNILSEIVALYTEKSAEKLPMKATIHQSNEIQPKKACDTFIEELSNNIKLHKIFQTQNLLVHLPVDKENRIEEVCEIMTSESVLNLLKNESGKNISIDLENNHHMSFFGNLKNCSELLDRIHDRLTEIGRKEMYKNINFCFDSGHYFIDSDKMGYPKQKMLSEFFESKRDKIKTLHLHSNDGTKDHHLLLGQIPGENSPYEVKGIKLDILKQNTNLLLDLLPILKFNKQDNWNIVSEMGLPYTYDHLLKNFELIYNAINQ